MQVQFDRDWSYDLDEPKGASRRFRAGWSGDLENEIAKKAIDDGAASEVGKPAKRPDPEPAKAGDKK